MLLAETHWHQLAHKDKQKATNMDAIKALVERSLEKKRVLSQMKAELRAQVFLAIDEEESAAGYEGECVMG